MKLVLILLATLALRADGPFQFRELGEGRLELSENGKPAFVYNYGMQLPAGVPENRRRAGYLHPVWTPDGAVVTDDFPKDHYHHRGIFWAWPIVRVEGKRYDQWLVSGGANDRFERWIAKSAEGKEARLEVENGWYAGERKIVKETVAIVAHPVAGAERMLEFRLAWEATGEPVEVSGQPDPKGYGGFSVRFAPREKTAVTTDKGIEARDSDLVPHPWARLDGVFGGRRAGLRIDIDPSNPGAPNGWCLRSYGFLGVDYPGHETHVLKKGAPVVMRYRVTLFGASK